MRIIRSAVLLSALLAAAPAAAQLPNGATVCSPLPVIPGDSSVNGVLRDTLDMVPTSFSLDTVTLQRNLYNGRFLAPLYRLNPNDTIDILVRNRMTAVPGQTQAQVDTTNQHFHGYIVTPLPTAGDNVVPNAIGQGGENRNRFWVPPYQSQGLMWYHPHPHGRSNSQVNGGLAGAMIIGDLLQYFPDYRDAGANERVMYIRDTKDNAGRTWYNISGNLCTRLTIRPGERQLWRIVNMASGNFVNLKLRGWGADSARVATFTVLAWDGNRVKRPMPADSLFISPGSRVEVVVTGWQRQGEAADSMQLVNAGFRRSATTVGTPLPLGQLVNQGAALPAPRRAMLAGVDAELADSIARLVNEPDVDSVTINFQLSGQTFILNNAAYTHDSVSTAVPFERVQEWTLVNLTTSLHTFHIHQTDFVVTRINGVEQPDSVHLDNVFLGVHNVNGTFVGDTVVVRFKYKPIAEGPFVYHCHVLGHEDASMMANMCVYNPATGVQSCRQWFPKGPYGTASADAPPPGAQPAAGGAHGHGSGGDGDGGRER